MKFKYFVIFVLAFGSSLRTHATPMLDVQINQVCDSVTLNWSVTDPGENSQGLALYVTAFDPVRNQFTGVFLGWWNATNGAMGGNMTQGWTDFPLHSVEGQQYIPQSGHWSSIFSEGTHDIFGCFFDEGSSLPFGYTPDGQLGGRGMWLESSYTVTVPTDSIASVSDSGSTLAMVVVGFLFAGVANRYRVRKSRLGT